MNEDPEPQGWGSWAMGGLVNMDPGWEECSIEGWSAFSEQPWTHSFHRMPLFPHIKARNKSGTHLNMEPRELNEIIHVRSRPGIQSSLVECKHHQFITAKVGCVFLKRWGFYFGLRMTCPRLPEPWRRTQR